MSCFFKHISPFFSRGWWLWSLRMVRLCCLCTVNRAMIKRPKTSEMICKSCFFSVFEEEVHQTIMEHALFTRGERVAIAASGGKGRNVPLSLSLQSLFCVCFTSLPYVGHADSTVLAHVLTMLNVKHNYGLDLFLLSIDEGITGYRDDSLEVRKPGSSSWSIM